MIVLLKSEISESKSQRYTHRSFKKHSDNSELFLLKIFQEYFLWDGPLRFLNYENILMPEGDLLGAVSVYDLVLLWISSGNKDRDLSLLHPFGISIF
jgi:hypothetical protein